MKSHRGLLPVLLLALLPAGCYSMQALDLSKYPQAERTLLLHSFRNNTFQPDGNVELSEMVRNEIGRRGNFVLTEDRKKVSYRLYGRLVMYRKEGRMFDNLRSAVRYELTAVCRIRLRHRNGTVHGGEVVARVEYSRRQGYIETERRARMRLNRLLAIRINNAIERYFVSAHQGSGKVKR